VTFDAPEPLPARSADPPAPGTPALPEPTRAVHAETAPANGDKTVHHRPKRAALAVVAKAAKPAPTPLATNGGQETAAAESAPEV
jgi:hypothetical protein